MNIFSMFLADYIPFVHKRKGECIISKFRGLPALPVAKDECGNYISITEKQFLEECYIIQCKMPIEHPDEIPISYRLERETKRIYYLYAEIRLPQRNDLKPFTMFRKTRVSTKNGTLDITSAKQSNGKYWSVVKTIQTLMDTYIKTMVHMKQIEAFASNSPYISKYAYYMDCPSSYASAEVMVRLDFQLKDRTPIGSSQCRVYDASTDKLMGFVESCKKGYFEILKRRKTIYALSNSEVLRMFCQEINIMFCDHSIIVRTDVNVYSSYHSFFTAKFYAKHNGCVFLNLPLCNDEVNIDSWIRENKSGIIRSIEQYVQYFNAIVSVIKSINQCRNGFWIAKLVSGCHGHQILVESVCRHYIPVDLIMDTQENSDMEHQIIRQVVAKVNQATSGNFSDDRLLIVAGGDANE